REAPPRSPTTEQLAIVLHRPGPDSPYHRPSRAISFLDGGVQDRKVTLALSPTRTDWHRRPPTRVDFEFLIRSPRAHANLDGQMTHLKLVSLYSGPHMTRRLFAPN